MLKNNGFANDTDGERTERVLALSENIDDHAVELGIIAPRLTDCQTAGEDWSDAITTAGVEDGESQEAVETLTHGLKAAHEYYVNAKDILLAVIYGIEKPDEIIEEYAVKGDAPWDFTGLSGKLERWIETDTRLKALIPPDPRVVNATIVTALGVHLTTITDLWHNARKEKRQKSQSYAAKQTLFDKHSKLLDFVFSVAKMTWGNDDPRLTDLGFVPSSEIWTPGVPVPGQANYPDKPENMKAVKASDPLTGIMVSCDLLNGAATYNIYREKVATGLPRPSRPPTPWMSGITDPAGLDGDVMIGNDYYYWMCGVDETNVEGAFTDAMMKWMG